MPSTLRMEAHCQCIACSRCCFAYSLPLKLLSCYMQRLSTIFFVSYGLRSLSLRPSTHCAKSRNSLPKLYCISTKWTVRFLYRTQRGKCAHERVVLRASSNLHASSMVGPFQCGAASIGRGPDTALWRGQQ